MPDATPHAGSLGSLATASAERKRPPRNHHAGLPETPKTHHTGLPGTPRTHHEGLLGTLDRSMGGLLSNRLMNGPRPEWSVTYSAPERGLRPEVCATKGARQPRSRKCAQPRDRFGGGPEVSVVGAAARALASGVR